MLRRARGGARCFGCGDTEVGRSAKAVLYVGVTALGKPEGVAGMGIGGVFRWELKIENWLGKNEIF